jgi:hypothetical protein
MPVRPLTDEEKAQRAAQRPPDPPSDAATYAGQDGHATYRGQPLTREEPGHDRPDRP